MLFYNFDLVDTLYVYKRYNFHEVLQMHITFKPVFGIRTRNRIRRIRMFLGLPDPDLDPLDRGTDPDPDPSLFS